MRLLEFSGCLFLALLLGSCASIPKEAPGLSEELGLKLNSIEKSHITLLHSFFDEKRAKVDEFINQEWVPVFANEFFSNSKIQETWNEIVSSDNKEDRLKFIIMLGPRLQGQINQKRVELIKPLDDLEKEIEIKIRNEYDITKSINNTITSFLYSSSKVDENRSRYLNMLGITDEKINNVLIETDQIVNKLVTAKETITNNEDQAKSYIEKIKNIILNLNSNLKSQ